MLSTFFLAAANHLLASASWARARLQPHAGRTARLSLEPLLKVDFSIAADGHLALWVGEDAADVILKLSPGQLPALLGGGAEKLMSEVRIEGNADLADAIGFVFRNLRWDAEEDLSRLLGDMAAHGLVQRGRRFAEQGELALRRAGENVGEFLAHESALLTPAGALGELSEELVQLRDRLARLEKRVARLSARS